MIPEADLYCHQVAGLDCPDHCGDLQPPSSPPAPRYHRNRGSRSRYPAPKYKNTCTISIPITYTRDRRKLKKYFFKLCFAYLSYQICSRVTKQHQCKVFIDAIYSSIRQHGDQSTYVWEHPQNAHIHALPVISDTPCKKYHESKLCYNIFVYLRVFKINQRIVQNSTQKNDSIPVLL